MRQRRALVDAERPAHRGLDRRDVAHRDQFAPSVVARRSPAERADPRGHDREALAAGRGEARIGAPRGPLVAARSRRADDRPTRRSRARSGGRRPRPRRRRPRRSPSRSDARGATGSNRRARSRTVASRVASARDLLEPPRRRARRRRGPAAGRRDCARSPRGGRSVIIASPTTIASRPVRHNSRRRAGSAKPNRVHAHHAAASTEHLLDRRRPATAGATGRAGARCRTPATRTPSVCVHAPPSTRPANQPIASSTMRRRRSRCPRPLGERHHDDEHDHRATAACGRTPARRTARRARAAAPRRARRGGSRGRGSGTRSTPRRSSRTRTTAPSASISRARIELRHASSAALTSASASTFSSRGTCWRSTTS